MQDPLFSSEVINLEENLYNEQEINLIIKIKIKCFKNFLFNKIYNEYLNKCVYNFKLKARRRNRLSLITLRFKL